jgi:hypothetical protein
MVAVGAGVGVVSGLLLSVVPTVVIALVPVAILAAVIGTFRGEIPRATFVAGMLAGAGALFTSKPSTRLSPVPTPRTSVATQTPGRSCSSRW